MADQHDMEDDTAPRIDGVDVVQLLRDIGEASAQESSLELFRLCLGAQQVLLNQGTT